MQAPRRPQPNSWLVNVLYLHGFASSPASSKAEYFGERMRARGATVVIPDLNEDDFEHLTVSRMQATAERHVEALPRPRIIVGSSLGGYVAALCASAGRAVEGLVLLAPAFDPVARWTANALEGELDRWRLEGTRLFEHYGYKREMALHWAFFEDAHRHDPWPGAPVPTLVLQGTHDTVVPVETAREYATRHPHVTLHEIDTDHEMLGALPILWSEAERFLGRLEGTARARR